MRLLIRMLRLIEPASLPLDNYPFVALIYRSVLMAAPDYAELRSTCKDHSLCDEMMMMTAMGPLLNWLTTLRSVMMEVWTRCDIREVNQ